MKKTDVNGTVPTTGNPISLVIFELVLSTAADEFPKILLLICCTAAIVGALAVAIVRLSSTRGLLVRMARRLGIREDYRVYTILGDNDSDGRLRETDGSEPATEDFHYVSMK